MGPNFLKPTAVPINTGSVTTQKVFLNSDLNHLHSPPNTNLSIGVLAGPPSWDGGILSNQSSGKEHQERPRSNHKRHCCCWSQRSLARTFWRPPLLFDRTGRSEKGIRDDKKATGGGPNAPHWYI